MDMHLDTGGETTSSTPSIDLLNRKLGASPVPRMLTEYENELMRQSAHEISRVTIDVLRHKDKAINN